MTISFFQLTWKKLMRKNELNWFLTKANEWIMRGGVCSPKGEDGDPGLEDRPTNDLFMCVFMFGEYSHSPTLSTSLVFLRQRENMKSNKNWSSDIPCKPRRFASNSHIIVWEPEREKSKFGWTGDRQKKRSVCKVSACAWVQSAPATPREQRKTRRRWRAGKEGRKNLFFLRFSALVPGEAIC